MAGEHLSGEIGVFLAACGATGPLRLDLDSPGAPGDELRAFDRPFLLVGRHPEADISSDDKRVSRRHAYMQLIGGRLFCVDLGSRTGISLPDGAGGSGWMGRGEPLGIGPMTLRLRGGDRDERRPSGEPSPLSGPYIRRNPLPGASVEIPSRNGETASWPISRALTLVGKSRLCKLRITTPGAARFYCSLIRTPAGIWMVDLLATERVLVNGERRRWARLGDGDELRVGPHILRLRYGELIPPLPGTRHEAASTSGEVELLERRPGRIGGLAEVRDRRLALAPELTLEDLLARLEQMGQVQERMCGQFQDAMIMLSQIFGTLHRDHMVVVREELRQIRLLTEEIHALRSEANPASVAATSCGDPEARAVASSGPVPVAPSDGLAPLPEGGRPRRDPREVQAIAGDYLAFYERERQRRWRRVLRAMMAP